MQEQAKVGSFEGKHFNYLLAPMNSFCHEIGLVHSIHQETVKGRAEVRERFGFKTISIRNGKSSASKIKVYVPHCKS